MPDITQILESIEQGNAHAPEQLLPLVYEDLRRLAANKMSHERPGQTLQATALVHEAWLKITGDNQRAYNNRQHFFRAAAEAMQRILVDIARRKQTRKHDANDSLLAEPPIENLATLADQNTPQEELGSKIGPYKLLQKIGEGGMGIVYMAEQEAPIKRKVARKIIKLGMDTKHVVARFEAERQALAIMDHPNIAQVLDGGATASGRPYFVMELVKGVPITEFCDKNKLSPNSN